MPYTLLADLIRLLMDQGQAAAALQWAALMRRLVALDARSNWDYGTDPAAMYRAAIRREFTEAEALSGADPQVGAQIQKLWRVLHQDWGV